MLESGQLTPEMLAELRGEGGDEEVPPVHRRAARPIDRAAGGGGIPQRFPATADAWRIHGSGTGKIDDAREAAQQVEFSLTGKGIDFLGYRTLRGLLGAMGKSNFGSHDTPYLATGIEAEAASRPYEFPSPRSGAS